jgi:hypothetical protein
MFDIINETADFFLSNIFDFCTEYPATARRIPSMLPLRNHFLQPRQNAQAMINKSRSDLLKSITTLIKVYDYYDAHIQIPRAIKDKFNSYKWAKGCLTSLKTTVENGGTFYYPKNKPTSGAWNPGTQYGINMDKFFTPGQLSINKLLIAETGSKRPKFYGWNTAQISETGKELLKPEDLSEYNRIGFKFDLRSLKEVFIGLEKDNRSLDDEEFVYILFPSVLFTQQNGKYLYTLYNDLYEFTNRGK